VEKSSGTEKYQQLDPLWELVAGTVWLKNQLHQHPFRLVPRLPS
jgi:hypothetical protein